ncbi:ATP-binding protein [Streptomyces sp. KR80]|uniref:ATP-binding protein n=1 Tax=Streptomyces sp. KR80 TaxID=3457426 RepID=UPI003FD18D02
MFRRRFSSTRLGARLARHLTLRRLEEWGIPLRTELSDRAALIVAELAANAVTHGRVPGRDFEMCLSLLPDTLRIEVSDTRTERRPPLPVAVSVPPCDCEAGRGLVLVSALAARWTVVDRFPVGKTVRAELNRV